MKRFLAKKETVPEALTSSYIINLLSKALGYVKYLAIAIFIGFNSKTDSYFIAGSLLGLFTIFVDVFDSIGVPNLVRAQQYSEEELKDLSGVLLTFTITAASVISLLALILSPVVPRIAVGFTRSNQKMVQEIFLMFIPFLFFSFFFHHWGAILRSQRKFTIVFLGQLIFSVISCIGILAILPFVRKVWVLPIIYSFAQGSATLFLVLFSRQFLSFQWKWNKTTKEMGKQFFLLIGSYGITHVSMLLDNAFASLLPSGMVTALNYGYAIGMMPSSLLYFGNIGIVSLSENHASQKKTKQYLFFLAIYSLPFIALTWLLLTPVLKVFLEYGRFSNLDLNLTAKAAKYYILSLPFIMIFSILAKAFQIKNKLHLLCTILALGCLVNFFLKYLFVVVLQWHLVAIPLSTLFVNIFVCAVGYVLFRKVSEEKSLSG